VGDKRLTSSPYRRQYVGAKAQKVLMSLFESQLLMEDFQITQFARRSCFNHPMLPRNANILAGGEHDHGDMLENPYFQTWFRINMIHGVSTIEGFRPLHRIESTIKNSTPGIHDVGREWIMEKNKAQG
jgi:hypothetical protein